MSNRLVILDRDGVMNHDSVEYIKSAEEWVAIEGSAEAVGRLTRAGFTVVVATNQSGLGRGLFGADALVGIHEKMVKLVGLHGGSIDQIIFCPHLPDDGCNCRKPSSGMLRQLAEDYDVALGGVPVIGDSLRDIDAASEVKARPILVLTGNGMITAAELKTAGRHVETFANLADAAALLIAE
ncbi:MAG: D-glycero-beta-D-manno-heptose 1,7-bisphosphate 7-phosphatase [Woeseiales bacterium]